MVEVYKLILAALMDSEQTFFSLCLHSCALMLNNIVLTTPGVFLREVFLLAIAKVALRKIMGS